VQGDRRTIGEGLGVLGWAWWLRVDPGNRNQDGFAGGLIVQQKQWRQKLIISDSKEFAFIHVPKCAGTSIRTSLLQYDTRNNYYWHHHNLAGPRDSDTPLRVDKGHLTLSMLKQLYPNDFRLLSEYTTFAISRHPRKRLISAFFEPRMLLLKLAKTKTDEAIANTQEKFREYVSALTDKANFLNPNFTHATPQSQFHVYRGKLITDSIITLENQQSGVSRLKFLNPTAGFMAEKALSKKREKATKLPDELLLWETLPQELQRRCASLYQDDCDLLGYKFNDE
jgi:hypothetical protein